MKLIALVLATAALTGCASSMDLVGRALNSSAPELYDGKRKVVIYCENANEHIYYLKNEVATSRDAAFISDTKNLIWNIKFSCT